MDWKSKSRCVVGLQIRFAGSLAIGTGWWAVGQVECAGTWYCEK